MRAEQARLIRMRKRPQSVRRLTMARERDYQSLLDRIAALRETITSRLSSDLIQNPQLADALVKQVDDLLAGAVEADSKIPPPPDKGLAELVGVGPEAANDFGQTRIPQGVEAYDETVTSERIIAVGDLYYIFHHERIGVFRVVQRLQELFRAGTVRLSAGSGAYALYQFDRREVLRYTQRDRLSAYRRVLGYGSGPVPAGSRANTDFHHLFSHFINQVTLFWRAGRPARAANTARAVRGVVVGNRRIRRRVADQRAIARSGRPHNRRPRIALGAQRAAAYARGEGGDERPSPVGPAARV